jgi:hydroxyacylglutathione hydrolase
MYHALVEVISTLPGNTRVFCGHEYTVKNLQFAETIEPNSEAVKSKLRWAEQRRGNGLSTVPSTLAEGTSCCVDTHQRRVIDTIANDLFAELTYNPFMRVREESVKTSVNLAGADPVQVMQRVRDLKDKF